MGNCNSNPKKKCKKKIVVCPAKRKKICKKSIVINGSPKRKKKLKKTLFIRKIIRFSIQPPQINIIFLMGKQKAIIPPKDTTVSILPKIERYFYIVSTDIHLSSIKTIAANQFINDDGETVDQFKDFGQNGYYNLYINAVLQEGKLYTVSKESLTIIPTGQSISSGTPIILESVGFEAELS
ncbi:DUF4183 domain-containing protein [Paenibacillus zanthoxyli]|uniref:DUF4183 domain-containing protein n=1 Tax=Paenibacillus zanthoxyli TaxID=369399 RepID=UPI000470A8F4|nr:DUF4183 domain-containing protein [Paenibacillus zanthoxyli]